jgi:hypothetical protein
VENLKLFVGIGVGIGIDGIVNENPPIWVVSKKRIVIEWAQRICSEKELFQEDVKGMLKGKSKKIENNHTDKKVNVDVEDFSKEPR